MYFELKITRLVRNCTNGRVTYLHAELLGLEQMSQLEHSQRALVLATFLAFYRFLAKTIKTSN